MSSPTTPVSQGQPSPERAGHRVTVVLVHGAFADASSWTGVIGSLPAEGWGLSPFTPVG
jgi:hypothetical protein